MYTTVNDQYTVAILFFYVAHSKFLMKQNVLDHTENLYISSMIKSHIFFIYYCYYSTVMNYV